MFLYISDALLNAFFKRKKAPPYLFNELEVGSRKKW